MVDDFMSRIQMPFVMKVQPVPLSMNSFHCSSTAYTVTSGNLGHKVLTYYE